MDSLEEVVADVVQSKVFGWDLECESMTSNPNGAKEPSTARVTHIAIAGPNKAGCWDVSPESMAALVNMLTNPGLYAFVFNAPYDHKVLHLRGHLNHTDIKARVVDLIGLMWLIDEEDKRDLKYSAKKYLRIKMTEYKDVTENNTWAKKLNVIQQQFAQYDKIIKGWTAKSPKRPYPTWEDPAKSKTAIRKELREADPSLSAKDAKEIAEGLFTEELLTEYTVWIEGSRAKVEDKINKYKGKINEIMKKYARDDAANLLKLYRKAIKIVREEQTEHVLNVEMQVRLETIDMQLHGMPIDVEELEGIGQPLREILEDLEKRVYDLAGKDFNIGSTPQVRELLFEELGITPPAQDISRDGREIPGFTPAGSKLIEEYKQNGDQRLKLIDAQDLTTIPDDLRAFLACDVKVLERIDHEIGQAILDFRAAQKLLSTYVDATLDRLAAQDDNSLHGTFNSWGTKTGRFASKGPNLQNIPSRGKGSDYHPELQKVGPKIREAFIAPAADEISGPEGYCLLVTDHSQIELRIIAHLSGDPNLCKVYNEHVVMEGLNHYTGDVHTMTAAQVGCKRKEAKAINFGFNYGMGPAKYAQQNRVFIEGTTAYDIEKCTQFRDGFFKSYGKVQALMNHMGGLYRQGQRKFPTLAGRYRHFYSADRNPNEFPPTKGTILNSMVQGSAGDLLKHIIYVIRKYVYHKYPGLALIGQVHDEVIYVLPKKYEYEVGLLIKYAMEYPWFPMKVPVLASAKTSHSWGAKDDDNIPEIGTYYARVDGVDRLFNESNWAEFVEADEAGRVSAKGAAGALTVEQLKWCGDIIPKDMPAKRPATEKKIMSRAQMKEMGIA